MSDADAAQIYREVMMAEPPTPATPFERATQDFVFGQVWARPGLSRRDRRLLTIACVAGADAPGPIDAHVYAALKSGDLELEAMLETVLHFAVYCGWPKASHLEGVIMAQWARIHEERGEQVPLYHPLDNATLGLNDWDARLALGAEKFVEVNLVQSPPTDTPYRHAGIVNFVFGHVWMRPGLTRHERRIITVACVALDDAPIPIISHTTSALHSGDITKEEMDEMVLHFAAYYGFAKAETVDGVAERAWATMPS